MESSTAALTLAEALTEMHTSSGTLRGLPCMLCLVWHQRYGCVYVQPFLRADCLLLCDSRSTFYTQDQVVGYTDYPSLDEVENSKKA